ncbi:uncharacterized protein [Miscanthus floridulus]|uniref:uncharacterized protein n=1 Tax=Miscanthus floridulus TaxID=154761 RepID=UPI003457D331
MDAGSDINILYKDAYERLNIDMSKLCPSNSAFHGIILGHQVHYHKETLSFEVINFEGPYHAIFRRPSYAKFVAVHSYTYINLKMPGLRGVITITSSFRDIYECEREGIEQANHALSPKARLDIEIRRRMSPGTTR